MCGRAYETYTDEELHARYLNEKAKRGNPLAGQHGARKPNFNLAPTQDSPIVRVVDGERQLDLFRWQYVPPWEPEFKTKLSTINAKSETVFESRLYKSAIIKHRCIVPLSGFFEWKRDGDSKRPFAIHLKDEPIMSVAGIWSTWRGDGKSELHSFAILTTAANPFMEKIHDRMPVILAPKDEEAWLDPELQDVAKIKKLLKPCPEKWLVAHEVSTLVNSPRNNRAEVLDRVEDDPRLPRAGG
ncbi:MAG: SOS response-associated peptidase [Deltaproteobacteria bacterium]|nr:SOS response-associated peptidase [Deltaproteobacteria bacterium]